MAIYRLIPVLQSLGECGRVPRHTGVFNVEFCLHVCPSAVPVRRIRYIVCIFNTTFNSGQYKVYVPYLYYNCTTVWIIPGAHNDVRSGRESRSVQRPRKRLNFESVPTLVPLLFLARTRFESIKEESFIFVVCCTKQLLQQ